MIPKAGHFVQWEAAAAVNEAIRDFIGKTVESPTRGKDRKSHARRMLRLLSLSWNSLRKQNRSVPK